MNCFQEHGSLIKTGDNCFNIFSYMVFLIINYLHTSCPSSFKKYFHRHKTILNEYINFFSHRLSWHPESHASLQIESQHKESERKRLRLQSHSQRSPLFSVMSYSFPLFFCCGQLKIPKPIISCRIALCNLPYCLSCSFPIQ